MASNYPQSEGKVLFWIILGATLVAAAVLVWPFFPAILWAIVLAVLLFPIYGRLRRKLNENLSALAVVLLAGTAVVLPLLAVGAVAGVQVYGFVSEFSTSQPAQEAFTIESVGREVDAVAQPVLSRVGVTHFNLAEWTRENREEIGNMLLGPVMQGAKRTVSTVVNLVVALLTLFFLLRDSRHMLDPTLDLMPLPREESLAIVRKMAETIRAVFLGVVLVAVVQGGLAGLSFWVAGVKGALIWSLASMLLALIPLLGAPLIYIPISIALVLQGHVPQGIGVLLWGFVVVSQIDNLIKPWVIGSRTSLHPMAVFFSLLGGVLALGAIGIMVGPMLLTLVLALADVVRTRKQIEHRERAEAVAEG